MGQAKVKKSATQRFITEHPICCFCGGRKASETREHMPPKSLFDGSHRPDKLVMPACDECNRNTSTADLVTSIISRWSYEMSPHQHADHQKLVARMRKQSPDIIAEWTSVNEDDHAAARRHLEGYGVIVPEDAGIASIGPQTIRQLNLFAHKVVLGLYYEHCRKPLLDSGRVCAYWKTKEDFASGGIPKMVLDLLTKYGTLTQGQWNERETFEYRYDRNIEEGLFGCLAKFRRGIFVTGFATTDASDIPPTETDWIIPSQLLGSLNTPRFQKKL